MNAVTRVKIIAVLHVLTAANFVSFWIGFYGGIIFDPEILAARIPNFDGYYAWETAFTVPDMILASAMLFGGITLFRDAASQLGRTMLLSASGGCIFLGILDFTYGIQNNMYGLGHIFSFVLLSIGIYMPLFGVASIWVLHKTFNEPVETSA